MVIDRSSRLNMCLLTQKFFLMNVKKNCNSTGYYYAHCSLLLLRSTRYLKTTQIKFYFCSREIHEYPNLAPVKFKAFTHFDIQSVFYGWIYAAIYGRERSEFSYYHLLSNKIQSQFDSDGEMFTNNL